MTAPNKPPAPCAEDTTGAGRLLRALWHSFALYGWFWLPGVPPADLFDPPYPRPRAPLDAPRVRPVRITTAKARPHDTDRW